MIFQDILGSSLRYQSLQIIKFSKICSVLAQLKIKVFTANETFFVSFCSNEILFAVFLSRSNLIGENNNKKH